MGVWENVYISLLQLIPIGSILISLMLSVLGIYTMLLAIKALKVYIKKNG